MGSDLMQDFEKLNKCLTDLGEAQIIDHGPHLVIRVGKGAWSRLIQNTTVLCNLSMACPKPINILDNVGPRSVWWTKGIMHNPNGPSFTWHATDGYQEKYTDADGYNHRTDGPSFVSLVDGVYEEEWKIRPNIEHRVGGPSHTLVVPETSPMVTWDELISIRHAAVTHFGRSRFKPETKVNMYSKRSQEWSQHGRPKNENKLYTEMLEEEVLTVTVITPSLIPVTHTFIKKLTYTWHDEDGHASRDDGPALIALYNVVKEDHGNEKRFLDWGSWDCSWFCRGQAMDRFDLERWVKEHDIELIKTPPVERSIFVNRDDAFCFLTDYYGRGNDAFGKPF